jgi:tryptophan-rich sensory protein
VAGGTIALVSAVLQLFAVYENQSAASAVLIIPEVVWELFLGIYLTFKGFTPSPILEGRGGAVAAP